MEDYLDFAITGSVPRTDAQIARAKRQAVGGKRKRCTKGKNCSAACIAAHMVCMVDLPWVVGSALTKSVAHIQAKKGKAPAAKPAQKPSTPAAGGAPTQTPKFDMANFKKSLKTQTDKTLNNLLTNHKDKLTPEQSKAIQDEIKARSKTTTPKAQPKKALSKTQQAALAKVPSVEGYKKWGLPTLEMALKEDVPKWNAKDPVAQKAAKNMREAVKQLKAEEAAKAKGAAAAKTAKAASTPKTATTPPTQPKSITVAPDEKWSSFRDKVEDAGISSSQFAVAMVKVAKAKGKSASDITTVDDIPELTALINKHLAGDKTALTMPAPAPKPAAAAAPLPRIVNTPAANAPKASSPQNPQGLSPNQEKMWGDFFQKPTKTFLRTYIGDTQSDSNPFPVGSKDHAQFKLVEDAQNLSKNLRNTANALKYPGSSSKKLPGYIEKARAEMGDDKLAKAIGDIGAFTGSAYTNLRAAQQGNASRLNGYFKTDAERKANMAQWKEKADNMEKAMEYLPKPQIPKMRGIPADDNQLKVFQDLAKSKGAMREDAMNSWSTATETAMNFARPKAYYNKNNSVIFRTLNKTGTPIAAVSGIPEENEILTKAGSNYKFYDYTTVNENGRTYHIFDVVEF